MYPCCLKPSLFDNKQVRSYLRNRAGLNPVVANPTAMNEGHRGLFLQELEYLHVMLLRDGDAHDGLQLTDGASEARHLDVAPPQRGIPPVSLLAAGEESGGSDNGLPASPSSPGNNSAAGPVHSGTAGCPACPRDGGVCQTLALSNGAVAPGPPAPVSLEPRGRSTGHISGHGTGMVLPRAVAAAIHAARMEADTEEDPLPLNLSGRQARHQLDLNTAAIEAALGLPPPGFAPAAPSSPLPPPPAQDVRLGGAGAEEEEDEVTPASREQVAQWRAYRAARLRQ